MPIASIAQKRSDYFRSYISIVVFVELSPCMKYTEEKNKASPFAPASLSPTDSVDSRLEVAKRLFEIAQTHYAQNEFERAAQHLSEALLYMEHLSERA